MHFNTSQIAEKWGVSTETVRRRIKKWGYTQAKNEAYVVDEDDLIRIEERLKFSHLKGCEVLSDKKWDIESFKNEKFEIILIQNTLSYLFFHLSSSSKEVWEALYLAKTPEFARQVKRKLEKRSNFLICNGTKCAASKRMVLKKLKSLAKPKVQLTKLHPW